MKFDYRFFEGQFLPIVPIKLKGKEDWMATKAYVDTGASYSLFHTDVAEILGLNIYGTGFDVIGRKSIFNQFIVCFNEKDKWVEFNSLEK